MCLDVFHHMFFVCYIHNYIDVEITTPFLFSFHSIISNIVNQRFSNDVEWIDLHLNHCILIFSLSMLQLKTNF